MKYEIHHIDLVGNLTRQNFFEEEVKKRVVRFDRILSHYSKVPILDIFLKKEGENEYIVTASFNMKLKALTAKEIGAKPMIVVNHALDKLRNLIKEEIRLERKEHLRKTIN